jgi:hypothetical protein
MIWNIDGQAITMKNNKSKVIIRFQKPEDMVAFGKLLGMKNLTKRTKKLEYKTKAQSTSLESFFA